MSARKSSLCSSFSLSRSSLLLNLPEAELCDRKPRKEQEGSRERTSILTVRMIPKRKTNGSHVEERGRQTQVEEGKGKLNGLLLYSLCSSFAEDVVLVLEEEKSQERM